MAEEMGDFYYHQPFQDQRHGGFLYSHTQQQQPSSIAESSLLHNHHQINDLDHPFIRFTDYLHGSSDFGLSSSPPPPPSFSSGEHQPPVNETPVVMTPNSSISSSSTEAAGDNNNEDSKNNKKDKHAKDASEDGEDSPKKENNKGKKKGEKKQKQPRFAFMTKSEVDHLEDGYRWRKYGQKAVKNSPYPRSYYRCTSQKCQVKKRVERSYQDPSIVITTYEGQHDHHIPTNLRGNIAGMFPASMLATSSLLGGPPELMAQMNHPLHHHHLYGGSGGSAVMYHQNNNYNNNNLTQEMQQQLQALHPDYGLLQDMVPSMIFKQEQ